jgi:putative PIN family toxin of toxin-antitoxin system
VIRAVLDTVFFVRLVLSRFRGLRQQLFRLWRQGRFETVLSEPILAEVRDVLLREEVASKHGLTSHQVEALVATLSTFAVVVEPAEVSEPALESRDPKDIPILGTAAASGAHFIVTEDDDLLSLKEHQGIRIVRPEEFYKALIGDEDQQGRA